MKLKNRLYSMMMGTAVLTGTTSCVSDLDQYPHTETTSKDVYTSLANYEAVLGKIYAAMVTSGQGKGGDNKDMESVLNKGASTTCVCLSICRSVVPMNLPLPG